MAQYELLSSHLPAVLEEEHEKLWNSLSRGRDSNRIHPECKTEELLDRTFSMTWHLQVIWRSMRLVTKAVVFRLSQRYNGLRLCGLLRCVGRFGWAAYLRCASTRKSEGVKRKAYGVPTVYPCTFITPMQAI
jgi:hypothetical protein